MRRFAPSYADHIARYAFALNYCHKKKVLDAGSKDGFGAVILSYVTNELTLADISEQWLNSSKGIVYNCPTRFELVDFEKDFPEGEWDTIVCFEVLEHVADPDFLMANVAKHLKPGGLFVFSTPHMIANHEHKVLFDEEKIKALISKHLKIEEFYIQDKKIYSGRPLYKGLKCYLGVAKKA